MAEVEKKVPIIELKGLTKNFEDQQVLKGIDLTIYENEFLTLLGPSGCGKTTTLRIIAGFEESSGGEVLFEGIDITKVPAYKREVNTIFQKYALFPFMNVYDNVAFGLKLKKMDKTVIEHKVTNMLRLIGLEDFAKRDVTSLSGGQQQRVAIARALVNEPKVLLLDEPLGALDAKLRKGMQTELKKIQKEVGITFIFVTHDQEEALSMSDTVVVMNEGIIQQVGTPELLVSFDDEDFECVDKGFKLNEPVEVVIRPEDIDIVKPKDAKVKGTVKSIIFKGVHHEIVVETEYRDYLIHTTDYYEPGLKVGLTFGPDEIHVMYPMEW